VKVLGRITYRVLKEGDIAGVLDVDGESKYLRTFEDGSLSLELLVPHRTSAHPTDFSQIEIRADGRKVFDIRWDATGYFKTVLYEQGDWERDLVNWDPIPI
jgi:hypothetical protein